MRKHAFAPFADEDTRVLVLGTLPGERSLALQQYYAHPQNRFWYLIGAVIGRDDLPGFAYPERVEALHDAGIGLWDTIASARRAGSLDAAIREHEPAALVELVAGLPSLRAVGFNGATAAKIGRRTLAGESVDRRGLALIDLPSSSPAHASMPLAIKRERWLSLAPFLA